MSEILRIFCKQALCGASSLRSESPRRRAWRYVAVRWKQSTQLQARAAMKNGKLKRPNRLSSKCIVDRCWMLSALLKCRKGCGLPLLHGWMEKTKENWAKLGKTEQNWTKLCKTGQNWAKLGETGRNWRKFAAKTGENWLKLTKVRKTGENWVKLMKTG